MAIATDLSRAAGQAFDNLHTRWLANQLLVNLTTFCQQAIQVFPQSLPNSNPVSNWITVLWAFSSQLAATNVPLEQLTQAAEYVYRLCWMAYSLIGNGITTAQASFLLGRYNVFIGF